MTEPVFFYGVVENNVDPEKLGRVQVRFNGVHTDAKEQDDTTGIPTGDLPWAICAPSITNAGLSGLGESPVGVVQGAWVMGVFRDKDHQAPVVIAVLPGRSGASGNSSAGFSDPAGKYPLADRAGESDVNRLARNEKIELTIVQHKKETRLTDVQVAGGGAWSEPEVPYAAVYPHNKVYESPSGHIREIDDTPDHERLHDYHTSGTFKEVHPDGSVVTKVVKDNYSIIYGDDNVAITGRCNLTIVGDCNLFTHGNLNVDAVGDMNFHATGDINFEAKNMKSSAQGKYDIATSTSEYKATSTLKVHGGTLDLIGDTSTKLTGLAGKLDIHSPLMSLQATGALTITGVPATINAGGTATPATPATVTPDYSNPTASLVGSYDTAVSTELGAVVLGPNAKHDDRGAAEVPITPKAQIKTTPAECGLIISDPLDYEMVLAGPFKLKDLTTMTFAGHHKIIAQQDLSVQQIVCNLKALCEKILIPLAAQFPGMRINSAFRQGEYYKGKRIKSQHNKGCAADLSWPNVSAGAAAQAHVAAVGAWIQANLPFDQIISEKGGSMWVHVSYDNITNVQDGFVMSTPTGGEPYVKGKWIAYNGTFGPHPQNNPPENLF